MAGLQNLLLPTVELKFLEGQPQDVWLLSNTGSYWYIIDCKKEFRVVPNNQSLKQGGADNSGVDMTGRIVGDESLSPCPVARIEIPPRPRPPPIIEISLRLPPCKPTEVPKPPCKPIETPKPPCQGIKTQCQHPPDEDQPRPPPEEAGPRLASRPVFLCAHERPSEGSGRRFSHAKGTRLSKYKRFLPGQGQYRINVSLRKHEQATVLHEDLAQEVERRIKIRNMRESTVFSRMIAKQESHLNTTRASAGNWRRATARSLSEPQSFSQQFGSVVVRR